MCKEFEVFPSLELCHSHCFAQYGDFVSIRCAECLESHVLQGREIVFFLINPLCFLYHLLLDVRPFRLILYIFFSYFPILDLFILPLKIFHDFIFNSSLDMFHLVYSYFIILLFMSEDIHWAALFLISIFWW